jgi:transglutaminase-like putative cysteine protease
MKVTRCCSPVAALLALAVPAAPAAAAERFTVRPPAAWVEPLAGTDSPSDGESTGMRYLLIDRQIRAGRGDQEDYFHTVWRVETTAGLQDASEIEISFDPSFERLVIHHARVTRHGRAVWSFSPGEVRVAHAEEDPEARLYDDGLTATIFVKGLRVGDTVDYAYTLEGENPVLGGRFDTVLWFEWSVPVDQVRRRVVWQRDTTLHVNPRGRAPQPTVTKGPEGTVYDWEMRGARAAPSEDRTPAWFQPQARVEVSEFDGWTDVARRSRELFAAVDAPAPSIDAVVRGWPLPGASEDARVDRAVRFVQDDVRYLGLEMGPHSHQPHLPADTLERRFGDCKDKAALLVAILRRLGVKAWPALVSTRAGLTLDDRLPSLFAFDHVIVALRAGEALQFVDATASEQGGPVRGRRPPPFSRALVLDEETRGLTTIPQPLPEAPTVEVAETYAVPRWDSPARLDVVTTYRGEDADGMRQSQARSTRTDMGKRYRDFYAQENAGIRSLALPRVEDDRERNVLVVREAYEIPALWKQGAHEFRAWLIDERLVKPRVLDRSAPLALAHPDHIRQSLTIVLPGPPDLAPLHETVESPAFSMDASWRVRGNEARLEYTYRSRRGSLPPRDVPEFADRVERAADLVVCRLPARPSAAGRAVVRPAPPGARPAPAPDPRHEDPSAGWVGLAAVGGCVLALFAWGARAGASSWQAHQRRTAFVALSQVRDGEQPQGAIPVDSAESIGREGFCGCGGTWHEVERASILYDGRPMTVATRRCERCAAERTLYFRVGRAVPPPFPRRPDPAA